MEKLPGTKVTRRPDAETISSWSCDMEGHAKKCVERYCELANKTTVKFSSAAARCILWRVGVDTATVKLVETKDVSGDMDLSESETWSFQEEAVTARPIAYKKATVKPNASSTSDCQEGLKVERKVWPHHLHMSPDTVHHTEAVFSIARENYGREHDDPMDDLDVNMAIWGILLNATRSSSSSWTGH